MDETGNIVIPPRFDLAWAFVDGIAQIKHKDKFDDRLMLVGTGLWNLYFDAA
jgi:WG containing repeat